MVVKGVKLKELILQEVGEDGDWLVMCNKE